VGTGIGLFHVKYSVVALEEEYIQTQKRTQETLESLHILKAEWTHLNDPKRLQPLAQKYLGIGPIKPAQFIPLRALSQSHSSYDKYALDQLISEATDDGVSR
jgi:hypothetical protein